MCVPAHVHFRTSHYGFPMQRLFTVTSVAIVLIGVGLIVLWARSYIFIDGLYWKAEGVELSGSNHVTYSQSNWAIKSWYGRVLFSCNIRDVYDLVPTPAHYERAAQSPRHTVHIPLWGSDRMAADWLPERYDAFPPVERQWLPSTRRFDSSSYATRRWLVSIPHWALIGVLVTVLAVLLFCEGIAKPRTSALLPASVRTAVTIGGRVVTGVQSVGHRARQR